MKKRLRLTAKDVERIRKAMNLTQAEFGALPLIDVEQSRVSEWENGVYQPSPRVSKAILQAYEQSKSK